jgi:hypothetical protein
MAVIFLAPRFGINTVMRVKEDDQAGFLDRLPDRV